jgi:hypothetical protein
MATHFSTSNPMHLRICLGNIDEDVRVQVDPDAEPLLPTPIATVHDLRAVSVWPKELAVTNSQLGTAGDYHSASLSLRRCLPICFQLITDRSRSARGSGILDLESEPADTPLRLGHLRGRSL